MTFRVTKWYGHQEGWSASYRNHRAVHSHCHWIHGYPLAFGLTYESEDLDHMHWVIDFGGLKPVKAWLALNFDHRFLVAQDDPEKELFEELHAKDIINMNKNIFPGISCEVFAKYVYDYVTKEMASTLRRDEISLYSVEVAEHEGNSATYGPSL